MRAEDALAREREKKEKEEEEEKEEERKYSQHIYMMKDLYHNKKYPQLNNRTKNTIFFNYQKTLNRHF